MSEEKGCVPMHSPRSTIVIACIVGLTGIAVSGVGVMLANFSARFVDARSVLQVKILPVDCSTSMVCPGEDLLYEVSWWIFKLGQIRVKTLESKIRDGKVRHTAAVFIDSYRGLPFVDVHAINYTEMDSAFNSLGFRSVEKQNDEWQVTNYHYDLPEKTLVIEETWQKDLQSTPYAPSTFDTLKIEQDWFQDGLSLLYYTRENARSRRTVRIPTIIYGTTGTTLFQFTNRRTTLAIEASKDPIRAVEFEGKAGFRGLFGLTGEFQGWVSDDVAAVPIKAKMKVILGSVNIELKEWERSAWTPPVEKK